MGENNAKECGSETDCNNNLHITVQSESDNG